MENYEGENKDGWDADLDGDPELVRAGESTWTQVDHKKLPLLKKKQAAPILPPSAQHHPRPPFPVQRLWRGSRGQPLGDSKRPKARKFEADPDNAGMKAWRARQPYKDTVVVPLAIAGAIRDNLAGLALDQGCFLACVDGVGLGLWGTSSDVSEAKRRILSAIGNDRSQKNSSFRKLGSLTPKLRQRAETRFRNDVKRNCYRQIPLPEELFDAIGTFHWPHLEYRPEDVLGPSYEALDPVRMDCECYINYHSDIHSFLVLGGSKQVQAALLRIRRTCFQLTAQSINPVRLALTHWRASIVPSLVSLEPYYGPNTITASIEDVKDVDYSPRGEVAVTDASALEDATKRSILNVERARMTLENALKKIHFYIGTITLVIRLGTFVLRQWAPPEAGVYELEEYEDMTKESQFRGEVTEELGNVDDHVLPLVQAANKLLVPQDVMTATLADVRPKFSAVFSFEDGAGDLLLIKSWHEEEGSEASVDQLVEGKDRWVRVDRDTGKATHLATIALTDLHTGSAWQFDITATRAVDEAKIEHAYTDFSKGVKIKPDVALGSANERFVNWKSVVPVKSLRQEVQYRYNIAQTDYTLDLVRFQDSKFPAGQSTIRKLPPEVSKSCWGLSVSRAEWATMFSKNERLPIGTYADWPDDMATWFPPDFACDSASSDGFLQLVNKLEQIDKLFHPKRENGKQGQSDLPEVVNQE